MAPISRLHRRNLRRDRNEAAAHRGPDRNTKRKKSCCSNIPRHRRATLMNRSLRSKLYMGICNDRSTFPASRKTLTFCTKGTPSRNRPGRLSFGICAPSSPLCCRTLYRSQIYELQTLFSYIHESLGWSSLQLSSQRSNAHSHHTHRHGRLSVKELMQSLSRRLFLSRASRRSRLTPLMWICVRWADRATTFTS